MDLDSSIFTLNNSLDIKLKGIRGVKLRIQLESNWIFSKLLQHDMRSLLLDPLVDFKGNLINFDKLSIMKSQLLSIIST